MADMAIRNECEPALVTKGRDIILARILIAILGCGGIVWGLLLLSIMQQQSTIEQVAANIISGAPYKREKLIELTPTFEGIERANICRPSALRSVAIIRLRILESGPTNAEYASLAALTVAERDAISRSLSCSPADPFLWLALFGMEPSQKTLTQRQLNFLRLSYRLGPNEGWISLKRNLIVISLFQEMPDDLREAALDEFPNIVELSFGQASKILTGPGWPIRGMLLSHLVTVDERTRTAFAQDLYEHGYDVSVPGTERSNSKNSH
jgi:hypothetical protein